MVAPEMVGHGGVKSRLEKIHHNTIRHAYRMKKVQIVTDFRILNRIGSPVFSQWENIGPLIGLILLSLVIMLAMGVVWGTIALILALVTFLGLVRPWIATRLEKRTREAMVLSPHNWTLIWDIGGVAVFRTDNPRIGCVAPHGNWQAFARDRLADIAPEESEEGDAEEEDQGHHGGEVLPP